MIKIPRKILVCAKNRCQKCLPSVRSVPKTCQWRILHPLEMMEGLTQKRGRQTGKTKELVGMANDLVQSGYFVYYITLNKDMGKLAKCNHKVDDNVKFLSIYEAQIHLRGMRPGVIIADEITDVDMNRVKNECIDGTGHLFLAHYWTPRQ